jgi:hypothetical protein
MWWLGLRDVEKERYTADGADSEHDERDFRGGFEAALQLRNRNPSYEERFQQLGNGDARVYRHALQMNSGKQHFDREGIAETMRVA